MTGTIDLTQVILAVLGLAVAVITTVALPWIKSKVGASKWAQFISIATVAIDAAEQLGLAGKLKDKFEYAFGQIKVLMEKHGLTYDDKTISTVIESLVLKFNTTTVEPLTADDIIKLKVAGLLDEAGNLVVGNATVESPELVAQVLKDMDMEGSARCTDMAPTVTNIYQSNLDDAVVAKVAEQVMAHIAEQSSKPTEQQVDAYADTIIATCNAMDEDAAHCVGDVSPEMYQAAKG